MALVDWSDFEVLWETSCIRTSLFFDSESAMQAYADYLVARPFTLRVETRVHDGPHGRSPSVYRVLKDSPDSLLNREAARQQRYAASKTPTP